MSELPAINFKNTEDKKPKTAPKAPKVETVSPHVSENEALRERLAQLEQMFNELKQNSSLENKLDALANQGNGLSLGANGLQGMVAKYSVMPEDYPDVTQRLLKDPKFARFALEQNYRFTWEVMGSTYTRNGITYEEPRFIVKLKKFRYNEDGVKLKSMVNVNELLFGIDSLTAKRLWDKLDKTEYPTINHAIGEYLFAVIFRWVDGLFFPKKSIKKVSRQIVENNQIIVVDGEDEIDESDLQPISL